MTEWPLKRIQVGRRFRKALGDLRALAESIEQVGLLHPVVVTPQGRLIAGRRRLEAVKILGWRTIPVHVVDLENIIEGELAENVHRKDFLPSELWAIAKKVKERVKRPVGRPSEKVENFHHCNGKTKDKATEPGQLVIDPYAGGGALLTSCFQWPRSPRHPPQNTSIKDSC